jgi:predicted lipoprotein with Yx(FWY)xxD motif
MQHRSHPNATRLTLAAAAAVAALAATTFVVHSSPANAAQTKSAVVSTRTTKLGRILVDVRGRTLYLFARDRTGKSSCSGQCASFWPPLITQGRPRVSGAANASLLGTIRRADGRLQVTYNHHPLYTFVKDTTAGQTNGEELNAFGAEWYALSTAGRKVEKNSSTSTGGYGG